MYSGIRFDDGVNGEVSIEASVAEIIKRDAQSAYRNDFSAENY